MTTVPGFWPGRLSVGGEALSSTRPPTAVLQQRTNGADQFLVGDRHLLGAPQMDEGEGGPAAAVEDEDGRDAVDAAERRRDRTIATDDREGRPGAGEEPVHPARVLLGVPFLESVDGDDDHAAVGVVVMQPGQFPELDEAGRAPARPEGDDHDLAVQVGHLCPGEALETRERLLDRPVQARVDHREGPLPDDCGFPETGLIVDAVGGGTLTLNAISDMSWQLDFTPTPGFEADIRVEADGLPNIFDFRSLRLIQWDCDCTNPRLAGIYDLESDLDNEDPFIINDFINEVPNITAQEFVIGEACVILNIASNGRINPINLPKTASTLDVNRLGTNDSGKHGDVRHLANDSLDIYFDDVRALNDITAETVLERRPFLPGERKIDIVAAADLDNSNPLWSGTVTVGDNDAVVLTIVGSNSDVQGVLQNDDGQRPDSSSVTLAAVHGMPSVGTVNLRLRDPLTNATTPLADNLDFGTGGAYLDQAPGTPIIEILTPDNTTQLAAFRFDFSAEGGETLTIVASEDASGGLIATAYKSDGTTLTPTIITATDEVAEIPQVYFLAQNFPNPFNPETTIHYAVPQTSHVRLLVFNVLGQTIATLVDEVRASGIHRATFDAGTLPSGPYVYRLDAGPFTATRMMMLLK